MRSYLQLDSELGFLWVGVHILELETRSIAKVHLGEEEESHEEEYRIRSWKVSSKWKPFSIFNQKWMAKS